MGMFGIMQETDKNIIKIPGATNIYEMQTLAFCRNAHLLRSVLSMTGKVTHKSGIKSINS